MRKTWDIFCSVVDNFGDVGVCWRLARQLMTEEQRAVRLWVDDLASLQRIAPGLDVNPGLDSQNHAGIEVRHWSAPFPAAVAPADVVIEAFACVLPDVFVEKMASLPAHPAWINLEYLSAEAWVDGAHALPSPHPRLPLKKTFFFPGFTEKTGGLLRERDLVARRDAFQRDALAQNAFWAALGVPARTGGGMDTRINEKRISLFSYTNPALPGLLAAWANGAQRITCLLPDGPGAKQAQDFFASLPAKQYTRGNLTLHVLPFVPQDDYDKLLWACDVNFVRGEDSFVRAQWAARPFVWHIYPQQDEAHLPKLEAFLDLYLAGLDPRTKVRIITLWHGWNRGALPMGAMGAWPHFMQGECAIKDHAADWAQRLASRAGLAENLANYCDNLL